MEITQCAGCPLLGLTPLRCTCFYCFLGVVVGSFFGCAICRNDKMDGLTPFLNDKMDGLTPFLTIVDM